MAEKVIMSAVTNEWSSSESGESATAARSHLPMGMRRIASETQNPKKTTPQRRVTIPMSAMFPVSDPRRNPTT